MVRCQGNQHSTEGHSGRLAYIDTVCTEINWIRAVEVVLTVHISFMFIFNESIAARFPCFLAVDDVNLEQNDQSMTT